MHSIINPIIDKLATQLSVEQQEKISQLGSYRLKFAERYGDNCYSLLCEEFIRTYHECIQKNEKPRNQDDFVAMANGLNEEKFHLILEEDENIRKNCSALGISSLSDLKERAIDYYNRFEKNELREIIFSFYQEYLQSDNQVNFEDFVLNNFSQRIKI